jgi:PA14 domain
VRAVSNNGTFNNIVTAVASVQSGLGTIVEGKVATINATDPELAGGVGSVPGDVPFVGNTAADDNYIIHVYKGRLVVTNTTTYTLVFRTDDGGAMRLPGKTWTTVHGTGVVDIRSPDTLYRERGTGELRGVLTLTAGQHDIELLAYEESGGASHEFYAAPGNHDADSDTPAWRLAGQPVRSLPVPGIKLVGGTNWLVRTSQPGGNLTITNLNNLANTELELANDPGVVRVSHNFINFADPQGAGSPTGSYGADVPFDTNTAAADDDFAVEATGTLEIPVAGTYQFGFRGDDGGSLQIAGQSWNTPLAFAVNGSSVISGDTLLHNVNTGDSHTRGNIFLNAGTYSIRALFWERGGGANFEVFGDNALNVYPDLLRGGGGRVVQDTPSLALAVVQPIQANPPVYNAGAGTVSVSWNSMANATYRVEWSTDYQTWTPLLSGVASQGATTSIVVNDSFGSPFVVFRIFEEY